MITRTVETLLDDGTLTAPWTDSVDVSGCIKLIVLLKFGGSLVIGETLQPFLLSAGMDAAGSPEPSGPSEATVREHYGVFELGSYNYDVIALDTIGFERANLSIVYSAGTALSNVTITVEKVIA